MARAHIGIEIVLIDCRVVRLHTGDLSRSWIQTTADRLDRTRHPAGFFSDILAAYHLREENYHIAHYFVRPRKVDSHATKTLRFFGRDLPVVEASDNDRERAERYLDILKFSGFVFAIFIAAAVSRLVR
jgi:hypothetical protein